MTSERFGLLQGLSRFIYYLLLVIRFVVMQGLPRFIYYLLLAKRFVLVQGLARFICYLLLFERFVLVQGLSHFIYYLLLAFVLMWHSSVRGTRSLGQCYFVVTPMTSIALIEMSAYLFVV